MAGEDRSTVATVAQTVVRVGVKGYFSDLYQSIFQRHFLYDRLISVKSLGTHTLLLFVVLASTPTALRSFLLRFCCAIDDNTPVPLRIVLLLAIRALILRILGHLGKARAG